MCLGFFIPEEITVNDFSAKVMLKLNEHMKKHGIELSNDYTRLDFFNKKQVKKNPPLDTFVHNVQERGIIIMRRITKSAVAKNI